MLRSKSGTEKTWFAEDLQCPTNDEYFHRFAEAMGSHGVSGSADASTVAAERQTLERFYQAQCLKDETMAESIARAWVEQTASGATKPATLSTGAVVNVPLFVNEGEWIKVDTRDGSYLERVNRR